MRFLNDAPLGVAVVDDEAAVVIGQTCDIAQHVIRGCNRLAVGVGEGGALICGIVGVADDRAVVAHLRRAVQRVVGEADRACCVCCARQVADFVIGESRRAVGVGALRQAVEVVVGERRLLPAAVSLRQRVALAVVGVGRRAWFCVNRFSVFQ